VTDGDGDIGARLEMLLVMQWLDEGAEEEGAIALSVPTAANELGLEPDRAGLLTVMAALGELEDRHLVRVAWPAGTGGSEAHVTLAGELRKDARRLFGRA
jgi:hypothetical protein